MEYLLLQYPGDKEDYLEFVKYFRKRTDAELVEACKSNRKIGIVGSKGQALMLVALHFEMVERHIDCPIIFEDNILLKFRKD